MRLLVLAVVVVRQTVLAAALRIGGHFQVALPLGYLEPFLLVLVLAVHS